MNVTKGVAPNYINSKLYTRKFQTSYSRLRLGYKYLWEVTNDNNSDIRKCRLCNVSDGHSLHHYVKECNETERFRREIKNLPFHVTLCHFLDPGVFLEVKKCCSNFANAS